MNTNYLITQALTIAQVFVIVRMTSNLTHAVLAMLVSTVGLGYIIKRFLPHTADTTTDMVIAGISFIVMVYLVYSKFGVLGVLALMASNFAGAFIAVFLP